MGYQCKRLFMKRFAQASSASQQRAYVIEPAAIAPLVSVTTRVVPLRTEQGQTLVSKQNWCHGSTHLAPNEVPNSVTVCPAVEGVVGLMLRRQG